MRALRRHGQNTTTSLANVSLMFWVRWKPWTHSPKELNRSCSDLVDEISSQTSGIRKYTRNASMNSVGTTNPLPAPGARERRRAFGVAIASVSGLAVGTALIGPPPLGAGTRT